MPEFGQYDKQKRSEIEPGTYRLILRKCGEPFLSTFKNDKGEQRMQFKIHYEFESNGEEYVEYVGTSTFDGAGGRFPASKLFLRLRGLFGVKSQAEAKKIKSEDMVDIPCIGMFSENTKGNVTLAQVKKDLTRKSKPSPVSPETVDPIADWAAGDEPLEDDINSVPF
jgi:hypothetical protein